MEKVISGCTGHRRIATRTLKAVTFHSFFLQDLIPGSASIVLNDIKDNENSWYKLYRWQSEPLLLYEMDSTYEHTGH
jgi:hypothetical protein